MQLFIPKTTFTIEAIEITKSLLQSKQLPQKIADYLKSSVYTEGCLEFKGDHIDLYSFATDHWAFKDSLDIGDYIGFNQRGEFRGWHKETFNKEWKVKI